MSWRRKLRGAHLALIARAPLLAAMSEANCHVETPVFKSPVESSLLVP